MTVSPQNLCYLSAVEQARLIKARDISPVELMEASLERIERFDPVLKAWITVKAEQAMAQARKRKLPPANTAVPCMGCPTVLRIRCMRWVFRPHWARGCWTNMR
jgi:Asp-tRNA(Asn)/Glu-tRNA(Gln) amidotransferase A subunit family amidase